MTIVSAVSVVSHQRKRKRVSNVRRGVCIELLQKLHILDFFIVKLWMMDDEIPCVGFGFLGWDILGLFIIRIVDGN
jgi:hypothetical protein